MTRNYLHYKKTQIFAEKPLRDFLEQRKLSVIESIEDEDYLLNVNEDDYVKYKLSLAYVEPLEIYDDKVEVFSMERDIPSEIMYQNSSTFAFIPLVLRKSSYKKQVLKFHVPFSGSADLIRCAPSGSSAWTIAIGLSDQEFCFEIINFSDNPESIKQEKDANLKKIMQQLQNVNSEIEQYNIRLESEIKQIFNTRKKRILGNNSVLASLGIPIKKADNVSSTFAIPTRPIQF